MADRTVEEVKKKITERIGYEKDKSLSFEFLEAIFSKYCTVETLRQALRNLVKRGDIIESGRCFPNKPIYNLK